MLVDIQSIVPSFNPSISAFGRLLFLAVGILLKLASKFFNCLLIANQVVYKTEQVMFNCSAFACRINATLSLVEMPVKCNTPPAYLTISISRCTVEYSDRLVIPFIPIRTDISPSFTLPSPINVLS